MDLVEILLVEDDDGDAYLTTSALRRERLANNITRARDGHEALKLLTDESYKPDIILLDLNLPVMSGQEFLREVRSRDEFRLTPVVVLTTSAADRDIVESYELNANCYVQKPIDLTQFHDVIKAVGNFWVAVVKRPPRT